MSSSLRRGLPPERLQGSPQRRNARDEALGEPRGQTIEEIVHQPWRLWSRRRGSGGLGRLPHAGSVEVAGEDRCSERFQVGLARLSVVLLFEPLGRVEQQVRGAPSAPDGEDDLGS